MNSTRSSHLHIPRELHSGDWKVIVGLFFNIGCEYTDSLARFHELCQVPSMPFANDLKDPLYQARLETSKLIFMRDCARLAHKDLD